MIVFSCVIPVKGKRPFLSAALESLRPEVQGIEEGELEVIVQDGDVEPDKGQSDALNKGFRKAKGEWLFWLNADDVMLPMALARVKERCEKSEWIGGDEVFIDKDEMVVGVSVGNRWHDSLYRHAVPHVHGPSSFFRRELLERVGGVDESLHICMDWDLWIRFMRAGARCERVRAYLWAQRRWEGSKTQRALTKEEYASHQVEISRMLKKNEFKITRFGVWKLKLFRFLSGCYFKEWRCGRLRV